jgi:hypothetical protein
MNQDINVGDQVVFRGKVWIVVIEGVNEVLIANWEDVDAAGYMDCWVDVRYLKLVS